MGIDVLKQTIHDDVWDAINDEGFREDLEQHCEQEWENINLDDDELEEFLEEKLNDNVEYPIHWKIINLEDDVLLLKYKETVTSWKERFKTSLDTTQFKFISTLINEKLKKIKKQKDKDYIQSIKYALSIP